MIPCRDDAGPLERCLQALAHQTIRPLEVIVVDNASRDGSARIAGLYGATVIPEPFLCIAAAAVTGYDAATGDIIVRCDADTEPPPEWLEKIAAHFASDPSLAAVTGPGAFYGLPWYCAVFADALYMKAYFLLMGAAMAHWPLFGSNMALRSSVWCEGRHKVSRTDAHVHDDIDLSFVLGSRRLRHDRELRVGISPRALSGAANIRCRLGRAFHTLRIHWGQESPGRRWQQRWRRGRQK